MPFNLPKNATPEQFQAAIQDIIHAKWR
jgi:hypothetical protein